MRILTSVQHRMRVYKRKTNIKTPCIMRTVLVVDDDPDDLAMTCRVLGMRYPVLSARSGEDALRIVQNIRPSIVVLDVMMAGGKDGFSVYHELQIDPATRDIPVLFLTNLNDVTGLPFSPLEVGAYLGREPAGFLEKPVSAEDLLSYTALALNA